MNKLDFNSVIHEKPERKTAHIHTAVTPSMKAKLTDRAYSLRLTLSQFLVKLYEKACKDK